MAADSSSTNIQETTDSLTHDFKSLVIADQGTFNAGGTVARTEGAFDPTDPFNPQGQTIHDGHANVFYQIPEGSTNDDPLVFLHGYGQSGVCAGRLQLTAARASLQSFNGTNQVVGKPDRLPTLQKFQALLRIRNWFTQFRIGLWPDFYDDVQFPPEEGITGNTRFIFSDLNNQEVADHMAAWLKKRA